MQIPPLPRNFGSVVYSKQRNDSVAKAMLAALKMGLETFKSPPQVIFWIMPTKSEPDYALFKAEGFFFFFLVLISLPSLYITRNGIRCYYSSYCSS